VVNTIRSNSEGSDSRNNIYIIRRKVLLYYVIVATVLAAIGTIMGLIQMFIFSGYVNTFNFGFFDHPFLQVYGFLIIFVSGVAAVLIPTFRGRTPSTGYLDFLFLLIMVLFQVFVVAATLISSSADVFMYAAFACLIAYSIRYIYLVWQGTGGARKIDIGDYFLVLSGLALLLSSIVFLHNFTSSSQMFTIPMIYMLLLGFVSSVIIGVMIKTSPSSPSVIRQLLIRGSMIFAFMAVLADLFIAVFAPPGYNYIIGILFLAEASLFSLAQLVLAVRSKGREGKIRLDSLLSMRIISFSRLSAAISYFWLIVGILLGIAYSVDANLYYFKIASIHSLGIGFIGSTIMGYAPLLLPGIISEKAPRVSITPISLYVLNLGAVFMVAAFALAAYGRQISEFFIAGGLFIVIGIIWYIVDIHLFIFNKKEDETVNFSDSW